MNSDRVYLRVHEAATYTGLSRSQLNKLRMKGNGPQYIKVFSRILYVKSDIDAWLDSMRRNSTSD